MAKAVVLFVACVLSFLCFSYIVDANTYLNNKVSRMRAAVASRLRSLAKKVGK